MPRQRARSDGPAGHLSNGKRSCENCYEGIAASSMSNTRRDTAIKCLPPSVTSVLRVLFPKGWTPPIDRGRRKAGSRSRIPRHQRRHGRKTEHSEGLAAFNHLLLATPPHDRYQVKQPTVAAPNTKANDRLLSTIFIPHYEAGTMPLRFEIRHRSLAVRSFISYRILPRQSFSLSMSGWTDGP